MSGRDLGGHRGGRGDHAGGKNAALGGVERVTWTTLPAVPVRVTAWTRPSSIANRISNRGEPAQQGVGADPEFQEVVHGAQFQGDGRRGQRPEGVNRAGTT